MKRIIPFGLIVIGLIIIISGFIYDVIFAGIPYPDPTPELAAKYALHSQIAAIIRWSGFGLSIISGTLMIIRRIARKKQVSSGLNEIPR